MVLPNPNDVVAYPRVLAVLLTIRRIDRRITSWPDGVGRQRFVGWLCPPEGVSAFHLYIDRTHRFRTQERTQCLPIEYVESMLLVQAQM